MEWFEERQRSDTEKDTKRTIPEGIWVKCTECEEVIFGKELERNLKVCPKCNFHFKLSARERTDLLVDEGTFVEHDANVLPADPLEFVDRKPYKTRLEELRKKTGLTEAYMGGSGKMDGIVVEFGAMEFSFIGGSMGSVVGEKVTRTFERAVERRVPVVLASSSGGARMMEGILSLMQMAKTCGAVELLRKANLPYISILTDPTTAGVMASYASMGDVCIAEPNALMGFAGPRVIKETIRQDLPPGFQRSEFMLQHGFVDIVVERKDLKSTTTRMLKYFTWAKDNTRLG
jgi:acetyl-CoA carboxylase carboxyl transferase subunit beta